MRIATSFVALLGVVAIAQEDTTRQLWNTEFLKKRPAGNAATPKAEATFKPVTESSKSAVSAPAGSGRMVGVTLWRVRDPQPSDAPGARLLVLKKAGGNRKEQTEERVDVGAPISEEDSYRFTIEVPATGYLYIIDRERYGDG